MARSKQRPQNDESAPEMLEALLEHLESSGLGPQNKYRLERVREILGQAGDAPHAQDADPSLRVVRRQAGRHDQTYVPAGYRVAELGMLARAAAEPMADPRAEDAARSEAEALTGTLEAWLASPDPWPAPLADNVRAIYREFFGNSIEDAWVTTFAMLLRTWVERREEARIHTDPTRGQGRGMDPTEDQAAWLRSHGAPDSLNAEVFERAISECTLGGRGRGVTPERWAARFAAQAKTAISSKP